MSNMVTSGEAARRLGLSVKEVRELLRTGSLRGKKVKNRWWICESELDERGFDDERDTSESRSEVADTLFRVLGGTRPQH